MDPPTPAAATVSRGAPHSAGRPSRRRRSRTTRQQRIRPRRNPTDRSTPRNPRHRRPTLSSRAGAVDFVPPAGLTVPSGDLARARANLAALTTLHTLTEQQRPATPAEQVVLAAWSGWGALPHVFDAPAEQGAEPWWPHRYDTLIPPRVADLAHVADPAAVTAFAARLAVIRAGGLDPHAVAQQLRAVAAEVPGVGDRPGRGARRPADRRRGRRPGGTRSAPSWRGLLTVAEWAAAAASTLNAHYTDPVVVAAVWRAVQRPGVHRRPGAGTRLRVRELHRRAHRPVR